MEPSLLWRATPTGSHIYKSSNGFEPLTSEHLFVLGGWKGVVYNYCGWDELGWEVLESCRPPLPSPRHVRMWDGTCTCINCPSLSWPREMPGDYSSAPLSFRVCAAYSSYLYLISPQFLLWTPLLSLPFSLSPFHSPESVCIITLSDSLHKISRAEEWPCIRGALAVRVHGPVSVFVCVSQYTCGFFCVHVSLHTH